MSAYEVITTTIDSEEAADHLAETAVDARLAACSQVNGPILSRYWWNGKRETTREWAIVYKTTADRRQALIQHIRENHPYDVPEIIATPIQDGNPDYLAWLSAETRRSVTS